MIIYLPSDILYSEVPWWINVIIFALWLCILICWKRGSWQQNKQQSNNAVRDRNVRSGWSSYRNSDMFVSLKKISDNAHLGTCRQWFICLRPILLIFPFCFVSQHKYFLSNPGVTRNCSIYSKLNKNKPQNNRSQ